MSLLLVWALVVVVVLNMHWIFCFVDLNLLYTVIMSIEELIVLIIVIRLNLLLHQSLSDIFVDKVVQH